MEALQHLAPIVMTISLAAIVAAVGLDARVEDLLYMARHPTQLLRALAAVNIAVPIIAMVIVALFPISVVSKAAILLMAISPVPPFVPGNQLKVGGRREYAYGLYAALIVLAIVTVPLSVLVLRAYYGVDVEISAAAVARNLLVSAILPLALGMAIRHFAPGIAARIKPVISKLANILLFLILIPLVIKIWPAISGLVGDGTILAAVLMVLLALAAGHLIGGPAMEDRGALAVTAATRHPGIAAMIAGANFDDKRIVAGIVLVLLAGLIAAIPYKAWMGKHVAHHLQAKGAAHA